jgi:hypothetical protein
LTFKYINIKLILLFYLYPFSLGQGANEKLCKRIMVEVDKFEGDTTYISQIHRVFIDPLFYIKKNGVTMIYLKFNGSTANVGKKGAILLLKDGNKIKRPDASIDCTANIPGGPGFVYTTLFRPTVEEIKMLSSSSVTSVRLYIYDLNYNEKRQMKQMEYLRCLQNI